MKPTVSTYGLGDRKPLGVAGRCYVPLLKAWLSSSKIPWGGGGVYFDIHKTSLRQAGTRQVHISDLLNLI